jgi:hypothetical protein
VKNSGNSRIKCTAISQDELPIGRRGKHSSVVQELLERIELLGPDEALKVALEDLPDKKANIRAALTRAMRGGGWKIATSSDDKYLYVWVLAEPSEFPPGEEI